MEVLAVIPARGGSKSVPRKNIKKVDGRPLIEYSIDHCIEAVNINRVIVSTDDQEIKEVAKTAGAEAPFLRPVEISGDFEGDYSCIRHCLDWLNANENYRPELIAHVRCTTPVRDVSKIDEAIRFFLAHEDFDSLRAVAPASFSPYKMWTIDDAQALNPIVPHSDYDEPYNQPRQLLPKAYQQDGFLDLIRYKTIMDKLSVTGEKILPFILDAASPDIDDLADIESLLRMGSLKK